MHVFVNIFKSAYCVDGWPVHLSVNFMTSFKFGHCIESIGMGSAIGY